MGHRFLSNRPQITEIDQDQGQTHQAAHRSYVPVGRTVVPRSAANYPVDNTFTGGVYQMHLDGRRNEYVSSNFRLEGPRIQTAGGPSHAIFPHLGDAQRFYAASENNAGHVYGNYYNGYSSNNFESGLLNPIMNPGRGQFKRKNPSIYESYDRGTIHTLSCEGSTSSSAQFHRDKTSLNYQNYPLNSVSRDSSLSIGLEDSVGTVRTQPRLRVENNNWRTQLPSYSTHYHDSSSHITNNPFRAGMDPNSNVTSHEQTPIAPSVINGSSLYSENSGLTYQHVDTQEIREHYHPHMLDRNLISQPQYFHGRHGHSVREGHGYHLPSLPPNRSGLNSIHAGYQVPTQNGLQLFSEAYSSGYSVPSSSRTWHNHDRVERSRITVERFHSVSSPVDAQNSSRSEALMIGDDSYLNTSRHLHDQYRDMRLDIDNMTYEELLALEERVGSVSTGLSEDVMSKCLTEITYGVLDEKHEELACPICLEEYRSKEEIGTLKKCGHSYHVCCIKKWLSVKNSCPICKASALDDSVA